MPNFYIHILFLLFLTTSCGNFFSDENKKPLVGDRVNVLHFDNDDISSTDQNHIKIANQTNLIDWQTSDVSKSSFIPDNLSLNDNLKFSDSYKNLKIKVNLVFLLKIYTYYFMNLSF